MSLRCNCTNKTRNSRRALRFALVMALTTSGLVSANAQSNSPGQPGSCDSSSCSQPSSAERALLPYPFAKAESDAESATRKHLVRIIGLHPVAPKPALRLVKSAAQLSPLAELGNTSQSLARQNDAKPPLAPVPIAPNLVVPASAADGNRPVGVVTAQAPPMLDNPMLDNPVLDNPVLDNPVQKDPVEPSVVSPAPELSGSFLDIEIPLLGSSRPAATPKSQSQVAMRLSDDSAQDTTFKLSDDGDNCHAENSQKATQPRGAELHLSSASKSGLRVQEPQPSTTGIMQVRIEGQPAPVAPVAVASSEAFQAGKFDHSKLPQPAFEPGAPVPPSSRVDRPILAKFASRMTVAEPVPTSEPDEGELSEMQVMEPLELVLQATQSITSDALISEVSVEHANICQLLKTGQRTVSIVGLRPGVTRVALITKDSNGQRAIEVREVTVRGDASSVASLTVLAQDISKTITRLYPNSDVQVVAFKDQLLVRGIANDESDAKKIVSLVRKTSLIPVKDELATYSN